MNTNAHPYLIEPLMSEKRVHYEFRTGNGKVIINGKDGLAWGISKYFGCTPEQAGHAIAVLYRLAELGRQIVFLTAKIDSLEGKDRCCGHEWRNAAGRLYMHHNLKDDCPMHGKAARDADRGLRCYVRQDEEESVLSAAQRYDDWCIAQNDLRKENYKRDSLADRLESLSKSGW